CPRSQRSAHPVYAFPDQPCRSSWSQRWKHLTHLRAPQGTDSPHENRHTVRNSAVDPLLAAHPPDLGVDELVDLPVQDGRGVTRLGPCPYILDALVRVQHVVTHLRPPAAHRVTADLVDLGLFLLTLAGKEFGLEHRHRGRPVLQLRALVLARDHDAGGDVRDTHRRVGGVDTLPTRTAGSVHVHA